jgi:tRNA 2-thiouridine synthesizing protein E
MSDIRQVVTDPHASTPRKEDRMIELRGWDKEKASHAANQEGIEMDEKHWEVIAFLRNYYLDHGRANSGRELAEALDEAFAEQGGNRYLYGLFPEGPVAQGSRIAGTPIPPYTEDKSFGSAM